MSNNITVYTALFTDDINYAYGKLPEYKTTPNLDFICYTNSPHLVSETWDIRLIELDITPRKQARKIKTLPQDYLGEYDAWIWMDNSCIFNYDPIDLYELYMDGFDMCVHEHCDRTNIFQEAKIIIDRNLDKPETIIKQINNYKEEGYIDNGLFETGILMRENNEKVISFNKMWWDEINSQSIRDQLSFPYVKFKHPEVKINEIKETFVAHKTLLGKQKSKHFQTIPRIKTKLK